MRLFVFGGRIVELQRGRVVLGGKLAFSGGVAFGGAALAHLHFVIAVFVVEKRKLGRIGFDAFERHDDFAGPCGCHAVDGLFLPGDLGHDEDVALVVANVRYRDFERLGRCLLYTSITGEMRMADGTLSLSRLRMQLFGGTATASGSYSTASDPQRPALQLSLGLSGASFSKTFDELEMVQKLVPVFAKTGGDYSLSLDMSATLDAQMSPDLQSVNATGEIKSANIRIQNCLLYTSRCV